MRPMASPAVTVRSTSASAASDACVEAERRERPVGGPARVGLTSEPQGHLDVLARGQRRPEVVALQDDRDPTRAVARQLRVVERPERVGTGADLSGGGPFK